MKQLTYSADCRGACVFEVRYMVCFLSWNDNILPELNNMHLKHTHTTHGRFGDMMTYTVR